MVHYMTTIDRKLINENSSFWRKRTQKTIQVSVAGVVQEEFLFFSCNLVKIAEFVLSLFSEGL